VKDVMHTTERHSSRSGDRQHDCRERVDRRLQFGGLNIEIVPKTSQFRHDVVIVAPVRRAALATFLAQAGASACQALQALATHLDRDCEKMTPSWM